MMSLVWEANLVLLARDLMMRMVLSQYIQHFDTTYVLRVSYITHTCFQSFAIESFIDVRNLLFP